MKVGIIGCGEIGERVESSICGSFNEMASVTGFGEEGIIATGYVDENGVCPFDYIVLLADDSDFAGCRKAMRESLAVSKANVRSVIYLWQDKVKKRGGFKEMLDTAFQLIPSDIIRLYPDTIQKKAATEKEELMTLMVLKAVYEVYLLDSLCDENVSDEELKAEHRVFGIPFSGIEVVS